MAPTLRRILLVEDSEDDEELAILSLRQAGVTGIIDVARDGQEALEYLFGTSPSPDARLPRVVLLDIRLPKIDGLDVLQRIRADQRTRLLPVVVLSSSDAPEDIARAYELGANSYVRKPVEFSAYAETVRQLGRYWSQVNEPMESL